MPSNEKPATGSTPQPAATNTSASRSGHSNAAADKGAGGSDPGQAGATPGGHYENTDHGYGTGIKASAGDNPPADTAYGGRPGQYDAGQRHNDKADPAAGPATRSTPASEEERHGAEHGSDTADGGYQSGPKGGEGVFGSNAPFGGGPDQHPDAPPPAPKK